jgi:hypothetical protein
MRPRWWLDGSKFTRVDWKPHYYGEIVDTSKAKPGLFRDSRRNELIKSAYEILNMKEALPADRQAEFDQIWLNSNTNLVNTIRHAQKVETSVPLRMPGPVEFPYEPHHFESHDKMTKRLMAEEAAQKDAEKAGRCRRLRKGLRKRLGRRKKL